MNKLTNPETPRVTTMKPRTQVERTREMQERLCTATLNVLSEIGYERASTTVICERAGVSRGAQTHHFPSKLDLILAAYNHLLSGWERQRLAFLEENASDTLRPETYIRFLWENIFNTKHYVAAMELTLAARGDSSLHSGMKGVLSRWTTVRDEIWHQNFESCPEGIDCAVFHNMTMCLLRGMTSQRSILNHSISNEAILSAWLRVTRSHICPRVVHEED